nr:hypothetical protein [Burkholderiales bacterium]
MKIVDPRARSLLAAEYVTGAMHGAARRRFELWLRSDPGLRREVQQWTARLMPLDDRATEVAPSPAVWDAISARIDPARRSAPADAPAKAWWHRLAFWRWTSGLSTAAVALLVGWIVLVPRPDTAA